MIKKLRLLFAVFTVVSSSAATADLAIIAHPDYEGGELDAEMVKKLFLSERTSFPSGHTATPVNHAVGSQDRKYFFEYVLGMGELRHKRYWTRKLSTGKAGAPKDLNSYEEVLAYVSNSPLGIAYIDKKMVNDSVKVLMTVDVLEDI